MTQGYSTGDASRGFDACYVLKKETQIDYLSILQLQLSINYMQKYCHSLCVSLAGAGECSPLSVGRPVCMRARSGCEDSVNRCPSLVLSYPWLGSLPYLWIPLPLSGVCFSLSLCRVGLRYRQLLMVKDPSFPARSLHRRYFSENFPKQVPLVTSINNC